jgi:hypothetical protein
VIWSGALACIPNVFQVTSDWPDSRWTNTPCYLSLDHCMRFENLRYLQNYNIYKMHFS